MRHSWALALALAGTLACGDGAKGTQDPGDGGGNPTDVVPCGGRVTIRLLGVDSGALTSFTLSTGALSADAGGSLPVESAATGPFELVGGVAHRLGVVAPPEGATSVSASLPLLSASVTSETTSGEVSICTPPIQFAFDPAQVHPLRCHVVVELSVARSIVAGTAPFLLPQLKIRY